MKIKNILLLVSIAAMTVCGLSSCSDDGDASGDVFFKNVEVDKADIELDPNGTGEVVVVGGNGDYTVRSSDEAIATATIEGETISITGHASGKASIIVTDKEKVEQGINVLVYTDVTLEQSAITVDASDPILGTSYSTSLEITSGNGGYKVECENPFVEASVLDDILTVSVSAIVTDVTAKLVDRTGRSFNFTITSVDHFLAFKANGSLESIFKGVTRNNNTSYPFTGEYVSNKYRFGWAYRWNPEGNFLSIQFPGTLAEGLKTKAQISYAKSASDMTDGYVDLDMLSILKNDGTKVWMVFRYKNDDGAYEGTMVQNIVVP